eukprot:2839533-Prymnesium_polylepis.1
MRARGEQAWVGCASAVDGVLMGLEKSRGSDRSEEALEEGGTQKEDSLGYTPGVSITWLT